MALALTPIEFKQFYSINPGGHRPPPPPEPPHASMRFSANINNFRPPNSTNCAVAPQKPRWFADGLIEESLIDRGIVCLDQVFSTPNSQPKCRQATHEPDLPTIDKKTIRDS